MDTKVCSKCGVEKPIDEFYRYSNSGKNKNYKDGYYSYCKKCSSKQSMDSRAVRNAEAYRYRATLLDAGCVVCGEKDTACLQFHHTDPGGKEGDISTLTQGGNMDRLKRELSKGLILLCANCHFKLHAGHIHLPENR